MSTFPLVFPFTFGGYEHPPVDTPPARTVTVPVAKRTVFTSTPTRTVAVRSS